MRRPATGIRSVQLLGILALATALLWLSPADSIRAQDAALPKVAAGPEIISSPESGDAYGPKERPSRSASPTARR